MLAEPNCIVCITLSRYIWIINPEVISSNQDTGTNTGDHMPNIFCSLRGLRSNNSTPPVRALKDWTPFIFKMSKSSDRVLLSLFFSICLPGPLLWSWWWILHKQTSELSQSCPYLSEIQGQWRSLWGGRAGSNNIGKLSRLWLHSAHQGKQ